jgi:phosphoribosylformylglycinamidine synthase
MEVAKNIFRFRTRSKIWPGGRLAAEARALGLAKVRAVHRTTLYFVRATIAPRELDLLGRFLFSDPLVEDCQWQICEAHEGDSSAQGPAQGWPEAEALGMQRIEVALRPGVTDPVAEEALRAARELGIEGVDAVGTGESFDIEGEDLGRAELELLAKRLLVNPVIHRFAIGIIAPSFPSLASGSGKIETFPIADMDEAGLVSLSDERRAALDLAEMMAIKDYFKKEGRPCSDAELETIAQTWSEHCVHKTFKARIEVKAPEGSPYPPVVDDILKTYIKKASNEMAAPWVLSAFVDNAGIIAFDDDYEVSFKVETHNHPSAVEPFGGANTGVGGVIRDVMGVSARPIAATDILCFGPPSTPLEQVPEGVLHPRRVASGVVQGVEDYGNKMGIPTVNGGIHYDPGYAANPLVYCGCAGIAPRGLHRREARIGDRVVVLGGRTGRDGIRGATFSSMVMDSSTGELAGASVQIGAPIVQKKVSEVILEARDKGLYSAITDCGAGGLSSAVGEMGAELGVDVDLDKAPLKYPGLAPWEIWLSEAQERMVLAVPPQNMNQLRRLCEADEVEMTDLGFFTGKGRILAHSRGRVAIDLECDFLHKGIPQRRLVAAPAKRADASYDSLRGVSQPVESGLRTAGGLKAALLGLLSHPAIASKEDTVRRYDHEVQGATVLKPYDGPCADGPQDAAVLKPRETAGKRGLALSNGFNPRYGKRDPYRAAISAVDEAIRNAVAAGADPARTALLDNFCMGDPLKPETMWELLEAARGCHDAAVAHASPFVSGKDSFNNAYLGPDGLRVSIPPSILISAMGIVPDVSASPGSDLKAVGDLLYLIGEFRPVLAASVFEELYGETRVVPAGGPASGLSDARPGEGEAAHASYLALHEAIKSGLVRACHDLSEGGLAVAIAEMCIGGRLGATVEVPAPPRPGLPVEAALFGETNGCLLAEVAPVDCGAFEAALAGRPCVLLGRAAAARKGTNAEDLEFRCGPEVFALGLDEIVTAFTGKTKAAAGADGRS